MSILYNVLIRDFAAKTLKLDDIVSLRDLNDKLKEKLAEKKRIELVIGNNIGPSTAESSRYLIKACNALLIRIGESPAESAGKALYRVRNYLVHAFSKLGDKKSFLDEIAWNLFVVLCNLSIEYKKPDLAHIWEEPV